MDNNTYTKTFSINTERIKYHEKMKKRKIKRIIVVMLIWVIVLVYFLMPISRINLTIKGNVYYSKEELMNMARIDDGEYWWLFDSDKAIKVLETYEYINKVEIKKSIFGTKMEIKEIYPLGIKNNKYLLNNGELIEKEDYPNHQKITNITNFDNVNDSNINGLINKYSRVNVNVRNKFYSIEVISDSNEYKYVKLFGYDGKVGYFVIKVDLVYIDTKFKENKYDVIIEEISKNNVKYNIDNPCFVAYHYPNENEFHIVNGFEEE